MGCFLPPRKETGDCCYYCTLVRYALPVPHLWISNWFPSQSVGWFLTLVLLVPLSFLLLPLAFVFGLLLDILESKLILTIDPFSSPQSTHELSLFFSVLLWVISLGYGCGHCEPEWEGSYVWKDVNYHPGKSICSCLLHAAPV